MASRTIDCESITLRTIYAKTTLNQNIPANYTLITDGLGGTVWSTISTAGTGVSFRSITVGDKNYNAINTGYSLGITAGPGIGFLTANSNSFGIYATGFQGVRVKGGNLIQSFSNTLYPTLTFDADNGISLVADPDTQTVKIRGAGPYAISTGIYAFNKIAIYSNLPVVSPVILSSLSYATQIFEALNPSSIIKYAGLGDIFLQPDYTNSGVYIGISSFTSVGYSTLIGTVSTLPNLVLSSVSTLFTDRFLFSTTTTTLQNSISNLSVATTANINAVYTQLINYTLVGQTTALGTSLSNDITTLSTGTGTSIQSTVNNLSSLSSAFTTLSTGTGVSIESTVNNLSSLSSAFTTLSTGTGTSIQSTVNNLSSLSSAFTTLSTGTSVQYSTLLSSITILSTQVSTLTKNVDILSTSVASIFLKTSTLYGVNVTSGNSFTVDPTLFTNNNIIFWSSATFSVPFFSALPSTAYVEIQYKPSFVFNSPVSSFQTTILTTLCNSVVDLSNAALQHARSRPLVFYSFFSNVYTDTIQISIDASTLAAAAPSPFTIYHTISNASTDGFSSAPTIISFMDSYATCVKVENPQR